MRNGIKVVENSELVKEFFAKMENHLDSLADFKSDIEVEEKAMIRNGLNNDLVKQDIQNYGDVLVDMLTDILKLRREL